MKNSEKSEILMTLEFDNPQEAFPYLLSSQIVELFVKHVLNPETFPGHGLGGDNPVMLGFTLAKNRISARLIDTESIKGHLVNSDKKEVISNLLGL